MMDEPYYGTDGQPITRDEWVRLFGLRSRARSGDGWSTPEDDPSRVALTQRGEVTVSTVWLGLDHSFGHGPPLIFETMVFGLPDDAEIMDRYATWEQAKAGHDRIVAEVFGSET